MIAVMADPEPQRAKRYAVKFNLNFDLDNPDAAGEPPKQLKGFAKLTLQPGERRTIRFDLSPRDLSAVTADGVREVMAGDYQVSVGSGQPETGAPVQTARFSARQSAPLPQ